MTLWNCFVAGCGQDALPAHRTRQIGTLCLGTHTAASRWPSDRFQIKVASRKRSVPKKRVEPVPWPDPFLPLIAFSPCVPRQLRRRCRMRRDQILPQQRIIGRPFCELCKSQMWLACIEPDGPDHDKRTFECPACPNISVRIVKYRSEPKLRRDHQQRA